MKLFIKILSLWTLMLLIGNVYSEYVVNREVDSFLQTILTILIFICIFVSIKITINLINKKQENND